MRTLYSSSTTVLPPTLPSPLSVSILYMVSYIYSHSIHHKHFEVAYDLLNFSSFIRGEDGGRLCSAGPRHSLLANHDQSALRGRPKKGVVRLRGLVWPKSASFSFNPFLSYSLTSTIHEIGEMALSLKCLIGGKYTHSLLPVFPRNSRGARCPFSRSTDNNALKCAVVCIVYHHEHMEASLMHSRSEK